MRWCLKTLLAAGLWAALCSQPAFASGILKRPACEPGYQIVEEVIYKDVIKTRCVPMPGVEKKVRWVYDCLPEPFCVLKCSIHGHHRAHGCDKCAACVKCDHPATRNLLIKRMVVEECPADQCVIETYVEKVACKVYRKVPCETPPCAPAPMMPPAIGGVALPPPPVAADVAPIPPIPLPPAAIIVAPLP